MSLKESEEKSTGSSFPPPYINYTQKMSEQARLINGPDWKEVYLKTCYCSAGIQNIWEKIK